MAQRTGESLRDDEGPPAAGVSTPDPADRPSLRDTSVRACDSVSRRLGACAPGRKTPVRVPSYASKCELPNGDRRRNAGVLNDCRRIEGAIFLAHKLLGPQTGSGVETPAAGGLPSSLKLSP